MVHVSKLRKYLNPTGFRLRRGYVASSEDYDVAEEDVR